MSLIGPFAHRKLHASPADRSADFRRIPTEDLRRQLAEIDSEVNNSLIDRSARLYARHQLGPLKAAITSELERCGEIE